MFNNQTTIRLETHQGIMSSLALRKEPEVAQGVSSGFLTSTSNHFLEPLSAVVRDTSAEIVFPKFGFNWIVMMESTVSADKQHLTLNIRVDDGVALVWRMSVKPNGDEERVILEGTTGIEITSDRPLAHFVAATLQSLLMLDESAVLRAHEIGFSANAYFADSLKRVGVFLQRRQLAYQLMVIENAFHQELAVPPQISVSQSTDIGFVYRAVIERTFNMSFWQDSFALPVNEKAHSLLATLNGKQPFEIEIGCLKQHLLDQVVSLGKVKLIIQDAMLINQDEVGQTFQQMTGHTFQATIRSLSGKATYQFCDAPTLPPDIWEPHIAALIALEDKLDEQFFQSVNQLAAASLRGLTEKEKEAVTKSFILDEEAFADSDAEDKN